MRPAQSPGGLLRYLPTFAARSAYAAFPQGELSGHDHAFPLGRPLATLQTKHRGRRGKGSDFIDSTGRDGRQGGRHPAGQPRLGASCDIHAPHHRL